MKNPIRNTFILAISVLVLNIFACAGGSNFAFAQQVASQNTNGMAATYNFAPITAAKPSEYVNLMNSVMANHTISVELGGIGAAPSVCTFQLEGSNSGNNWFSLSGAQSCTTAGLFTYTLKPVRFVRVNVLTFVGPASLSFFYTATR